MSTALTQRDHARRAVRSALKPFGYDADCVRFGWTLPDAEAVRQYNALDQGDLGQLPRGHARLLDVLAFSDRRRQDWSTSAVAADLLQDDVVGSDTSQGKARELFSLTAAPTILLGSLARGQVDVWLNCHNGMVGAEQVDLNAEALRNVFSQHRPAIERDQLAHFRQEQRHLFDDYLYARRDELATALQRGVSKATWVVRDLSWGADKASERATREAFSRLALAILASRILEDKGALGEGRGQCTEARQLLLDSRQRWDSFFDTVLDRDLPRLDGWFKSAKVDAMLQCLLRHLTGPVNFGLVTHEMLGDLYERALVAERRPGVESFIKLKGVHYTQLSITRQILDRIPLENLPPQRRAVCDFACGSGSFLLAATERLAALFDPREPESPGDALSYLRDAVMGNDLDRVAILVARLSYLLAYWNMTDLDGSVPYPCLHEGGDALTLDPITVFGRLPAVFVTNPPFDVKGQPASAFMLRVLELLSHTPRNSPAFVGMVMPAAFLTGEQTQKEARRRLLDVARILEVWELPERAIGQYAEAPTCVVIAEVGKSRPGHEPIRVSQTFSRQREAIRALRDFGVPTWSYVAALGETRSTEGQGSPPMQSITFSAVDDLWDRMGARQRTVSSLASGIWGFLHTRDRNFADPEFSCAAQDETFVPYLKHQRALAPYLVTREDWIASHDDDQRYWKRGTGPRPRKTEWPRFESEKIIITARGNRNSSSQLVAALDYQKLYPGKDFLSVVLRDDWPDVIAETYAVRPQGSSDILRWLCAILNSPLGHAWFAKQAGPRGPRAEMIMELPLPEYYEPQISSMVSRIENLPRPRNLRAITTWEPEAGVIPENTDLYGEEPELARRDNAYWNAVLRLKGLVLKSYGLSSKDADRLRIYLKGMTDPWVDHDSEVAALSDHAVLRVLRGKTIKVDATLQEMKAEFSWRPLGNGEAVVIPVPRFMPGWALGEGQEFICRAPVGTSLDSVKANPWLLREFRPVSYMYLGAEALEKMVGYKKVVER